MNRLACDCIIQDKLHVQARASYTGLATTGPAMMGARCLWPRLCPVSQLSPGRELCLRWWGWWWPLDPDPGSPGQLPSSLCAVQAAQARVSVTPVSVTQHSPARPQVTQVTPATQSRSAQIERVLVTHCQPPVRSDIHQCWGSGDCPYSVCWPPRKVCDTGPVCHYRSH